MTVMFLAQLVDAVATLYSLVIVARAFLSMMGIAPYNSVVRFIYDITEPILAPLRRYAVVGMWDLSPMAALIILMIVRQLLITLLLSLG